MWELLLDSVRERKEYLFLICYTGEGQIPSETIKSYIQNVIPPHQIKQLECEQGYSNGLYHTHPDERDIVAPSSNDVLATFRYIGTHVSDFFIGGVTRNGYGVINMYRVTSEMRELGRKLNMLEDEYERRSETSSRETLSALRNEINDVEAEFKGHYRAWIDTPFCQAKKQKLTADLVGREEKEPWWKRLFT